MILPIHPYLQLADASSVTSTSSQGPTKPGDRAGSAQMSGTEAAASNGDRGGEWITPGHPSIHPSIHSIIQSVSRSVSQSFCQVVTAARGGFEDVGWLVHGQTDICWCPLSVYIRASSSAAHHANLREGRKARSLSALPLQLTLTLANHQPGALTHQPPIQRIPHALMNACPTHICRCRRRN